MNEKVYIQDLINLVAERQGITKKEAENFLKTMFDLIEEVLNEDQFVKIKGLGTFKLTKVGSRESIDVNTGERFVIEGHTKLSFIPENSVRDLINKPFSHFETVILNDNTVFDDEEEDSQEDEPEEQDETSEGEITDNRITAQNNQEEEEKGQGVDHTSSVAEETCISEKISVAPASVESPIEDIKPDNDTTNQIHTTNTSLSEKEEADINLSTTDLEATKVEEETRTDYKQNIEITENEEVEQPVPTISISDEDELPDEKEKAETPEEEILSVKDDSDKEQAVPVTKRKNRAISYIVVLLVTVLMLTGITFYIFKPDIINIFFTKDTTPEVITEAEVTSPVVPEEEPEIIPNDTVENTIVSEEDTLAVIAPSVSSTEEVPVPEEKVIIEEEVIKPPVKTTVQPTVRPPVDDLTKTIITGIREDAADVIPDSTSYVIVGTMDQYTVRVGETLTRISNSYYGTKDLWPYLVMHNRGVITNPDNVPVGTTIKIPALRDKK